MGIKQDIGRRTALLSLFFIGALSGVFGSLMTRRHYSKKIDDIKNNRNSTENAYQNLIKGYPVIEEYPELTEENAFKMINFLWSENDPNQDNYKSQILNKAPERLKELVSEMTNNRFDIEISSVSKTEKTQNTTITETILSQVNNGELDCAYSGIYYDNTQELPLYFTTAIPFGLTPQEQMAWFNHRTKESEDKGLTYVQLLYVKDLYINNYKNIHALPLACTGMQMGGWFRKEINTIEDFRGLKMRIPGLGKEILINKFGVIPVSQCLHTSINGQCMDDISIPGHLIKDRLIDETLDAAEWISPHEDMAFGIHELSNDGNAPWYYYYPAWWEPSTTFSIHINKNSWDNKLSKTYRAIFESACSRVFNEILAQYNYENGKALKRLKTEYKNKIKVLPFNREILRASQDATDEYLNDLIQGNVDHRKVFDEWKDFKSDIRAWSQFEAYYTNWDDPV